MIRVKAPPSVRSNAFPIHVVVVLDVSGTTGQRATGPKFDLLKMMEFIKGEFDADATQYQVDVATADKPMPIADWISVQGKKENHILTGGTGLEQELNCTLQALEESSGNRVGFVILLSDGESMFAWDPFVQNLSKFPVHALHLGKNHVAAVLHRIAETSGGTYSSVPVADTDTANLNNSKLVMEAIAVCLGGLKSVVAIGTLVKISVPDDRKNTLIKDLRIVEIQSGGHQMTIDSEKRKGKITVGVLYAGEVKDFIVRIQFKSRPSESTNGQTRSSFLTADVEYLEAISSKQRKPAAQCKVPLLVTSSNDKDARNAYGVYKQLAPNSRVLQQMILFEVVKMLLSFAEEANTTNNNVTGGNLRNKWEELNGQGNLLMARKKDLVDLRGIDEVMAAMTSRLEEGSGSGLGCIYAWVSSYQMQRATTTGLPLPATPYAFRTAPMDEMVRNARKHLVAQEKQPVDVAQPQQGAAAEVSAAPPPTTLDEEKSKIALRLFDYIINQFQAAIPPDELSVSEGDDASNGDWDSGLEERIFKAAVKFKKTFDLKKNEAETKTERAA